MTQDRPTKIPAPCIIDFGIIINTDDMRRLLDDLERVRYFHILDGKIQSEGEGWVVEVFDDPHQSTLIANSSIYINILSFDYLHLHQSPEKEIYLDLIQDNRLLRLIPLSNVLQEQEADKKFDAATIEEMVTKVISAKWDVQFDEDDNDCPF
jgi:hypothetical protein